MPAAHSWSRYEGSCSTLYPDPELVAHFEEDTVALGIARIEAHYFVNDIFLPDNSLLANVDRIRNVPGVIVQGRYDAVCPIVSADDLHRAWPQAEYQVIADAGHSVWEPGIAQQLVRATDAFRLQLKRSPGT
jgi:proline iminopeptidase